MAKTLIYLAAPYTHPSADVREARFALITLATARLMERRLHIYSPISNMHPVALVGNLPTNWEYWAAFDHALLECCYKLMVLQLPGWKESVGVNAEITIARNLGLEIEYLDPAELIPSEELARVPTVTEMRAE